MLRELACDLTNDHSQLVQITTFVAVLCLCLVIGHLLQDNNRWVNESITAILILALLSPSMIMNLIGQSMLEIDSLYAF